MISFQHFAKCDNKFWKHFFLHEVRDIGLQHVIYVKKNHGHLHNRFIDFNAFPEIRSFPSLPVVN